ncbi:GlsB/YeaQ/YmgE family stress response membrane protein [Thalassoglobus polymorphus]|uniref:Transglycosylase associated protein n=1 Tax=Thalassoglobus polymorphus TaxID=2527994 RepID=A0A517QV65_9PLAN|nr:GlsB/YeaQ/YmgE family stress response membrane protein [Thalassoglobus polymorphus]QDT35522.1 Transglycosylase associated protein [Thalassoglobus polymorphus]
MTFVEILLLLLIAGICGSIGQAIVGRSKVGCLGSIALGFVGAMLGRWLAMKLGLPEQFAIQIDSHTFPVVWSIVGASLFVALICLISGSQKR